ncbi:MAG: S4A5 electrogenic sodium bicarbonate cotransporter 4 [Eggerthellaceae bacterium]|nr:S4A5 electrogenic sodium bicarbonate cotransporter 4 [Eggerthellaceae bacterium]
MRRERNSAQGSVRIGPISVFSLIVLLSIAVMSVLSYTTAQATFASAEKHSRFTADTYANEIAAQEMLALVDSTLYNIRANNGTQADAIRALNSLLPNTAKLEGAFVKAEFSQESGRILTVTLAITDNAYYRIIQWQATTRWDETGDEINLWSGTRTE